MTVDELIAELPAVPGEWRVDGQWLRCRVVTGQDCCPITAVYFARTKTFMASAFYAAAAARMGLPLASASDVATAADGQQKLTDYEQRLRAQMFAALGLKE